MTIGIVLVICLVGCQEKSKFSINKNDSLETYANNPTFVRTEVDNISVEKKDVESIFSYKFTAAPECVLDDIQTSDLNVLDGYVIFNKSNPKQMSSRLTMKGKVSLAKLLDRVKKSDNTKNIKCINIGAEKGYGLLCMNYETRANIIINYDPFIYSISFSFIQR